MLTMVQKGTGERRALVLCYFVGPAAVPDLLAAIGPGPCVLTDCDNPAGRFSKAPGSPGGVDDVGSIAFTKALAPAGPFEVSDFVLVGWSAGCQAVREQLRAGMAPAAVVALDGISGSWPGPAPAQLAPWRDLVERALVGEALFVVSHTQQTYTETIPPGVQGGPFASTVTTARILCQDHGLDAPGPGEEATFGEAFHVRSCPSATISGSAHIAQVRQVLPDVARRILAPWLAARAAAPAQEAEASA